MLRGLMDKINGRDLVARRKAGLEENDEIKRRAIELETRLTDVQQRSKDIIERQVPAIERQTDLLRAISLLPAGAGGADEAWASRMDAALDRLDSQREDLDEHRDQVNAEVEPLTAESKRLSDDQKSLAKTFADIDATERRRLRRVAQWVLISQIVALAIALIFHASGHAVGIGGEVHLTYYSAVAVMMPVFLVAGLVELALIRVKSGGWTVVTFAVPNLEATGAALYVLVTHRTTFTTLLLTISGLAVTLFVLLVYFIGHTEWGPDT